MYLLNSPNQGNVDAIRTFFNAIAADLPAGLTIQVPNSGDVIGETDGRITGTWSVPTLPTLVTGTGAGAYSGTSGAVVHWLTSAVVAGRRVRGRTFIVPVIGSDYDATGALSGTALTRITNAAAAYVSGQGGVAVVWSRPAPGRTGSLASITSSRVPKLAVTMRSRRV